MECVVLNGKIFNIIKDIIQDLGWRSMHVVPKILAGRVIHGMDAATIVALDLQNQPFLSWPKFAANGQMWSFFSYVNNRNGGDEFFRDKVLACGRCVEHGIPIIPILAVVGRKLSRPHPFRALFNAADVEALLESDVTPSELFVKPAGGDSGSGAFSAVRADGGWVVEDELFTSRALAQRIVTAADDKGMIVQPCAKHPAGLAAIGAEFGLATMRVQTALTRSGPRVLYVVQKILGGRHEVDNYSDGAKGNLLALVDLETGQLGRAFGLPESRRRVLASFGTHPLTGARIEGSTIPEIASVVQIAEKIALAFPQSRLLGSDLAITTEGVQLVETNNGPGQNLIQIPGRVGLADMFGDVVPELAMTDAEVAEAMRIFAVCINKRWKTVRVPNHD